MTDTDPSTSETDADEEPPTMTFRRREGTDEEPPPPRTAYSHIFQNTNSIHPRMVSIIDNDIRLFDGMNLGWIVYAPSTIRFESAVEDDPDRVSITVDTLWDVELPAGYDALVMTPFNHHVSFRIVDERVRYTPDPVELSATMIAPPSGYINRGSPILQLVPIRRDSELLEGDATPLTREEKDRLLEEYDALLEGGKTYNENYRKPKPLLE